MEINITKAYLWVSGTDLGLAVAVHLDLVLPVTSLLQAADVRGCFTFHCHPKPYRIIKCNTV